MKSSMPILAQESSESRLLEKDYCRYKPDIGRGRASDIIDKHLKQI